MNAEIFQVSKLQFIKMLGEVPAKEAALTAAGLSTEILVGMFNDEALCFVGLAPRTLLSDTAYIWMITTDAGLAHPIILARYSKGLIDTALVKYSMLFGHCFVGHSAQWLRWLGARFLSETEFEIRRR